MAKTIEDVKRAEKEEIRFNHKEASAGMLQC